MSYALLKTTGDQKGYYVYANNLIHFKLKEAKLFETMSETRTYRKRHPWMKTYKIVKVTEKQLFVARLAE